MGVGFLLYSVIAFGLQAPVGALCDKYPRLPVGVMGCVLVAGGLFVIPAMWAPLLLCAVGNALFHVGGGMDSLVHARGKIRRSGIFVSSGAVGLASGAIAGGMPDVPILLPVLLLAASTAFILLCRLPKTDLSARFGTDGPSGKIHAVSVALAVLFIVIMVRSYGGFILYAPWRADFLILPSIGACLGKACGGLLADRLGARNVGAFSLLLCIPFLCFGWQWPLWGCIGIALFNMNMPITLCAVSDRLPGHPGLTFGFTTLALLCGSILPFFYALPWAVGVYLLPLLCAAAAVLIFFTLSNKGGTSHELYTEGYSGGRHRSRPDY